MALKVGIKPPAQVEERARAGRTLKRMKEMQDELKRRFTRGELTREEYASLREKYEKRIKELEGAQGASRRKERSK